MTDDTMRDYHAAVWARLKAKAASQTPEGLMVAAAKAWQDLQDEIAKKGAGPHSDYWGQSLYDADYALNEAARQLLAKRKEKE